MKKMRRILALVLAMVMVFSMAACGKKDTAEGTTKSSGTAASSSSSSSSSASSSSSEKQETYEYNITVWVPELAVELTDKQIKDFNATNTDGITLNATIEAVSEADSATTMITDVESGADIYFFAQDQTARLIQSGALSKLGKGAAESITSANAAGVVSACMSGDEMYAYPLTADNGYFMYYDKRVVDESHIDSLEDLIADCEKAGKSFCFEMQTSAWYLASFFFGTGCVSEWTTTEDGGWASVNDDFNSDKGLIAAKGLYKLVTSPAHNSSSDGTQFDAAIPAGIVVSGTWDYNNVYGILGENMGVADLPSFTVDGKSYHLGSYNGCKLLGVKPQVDAARGACINKLAQYLVSEKAQLERFEALAWGPANTAAQNSPSVQANPGLAALLQQAPYSIPQGQIHGSWWDIGKVIGTDVKDSDGSDAGLKAALVKYEKTIQALFNQSDDEKSAMSVIGSIGGDSWSIDIPMTRSAEIDAPTYYTDALTLKAGEEFKVRQGASWDVNFGADGEINGPNVVVDQDGVYFIKLVTNDDFTHGDISLVKSSYLSWSVIGSIAGDGWTIDIPMEIQADGTTFVTPQIALKAGEEFKVRLGHGWDVCYGTDGNNFVVPSDGTFDIVFDSTTGLITLK